MVLVRRQVEAIEVRVAAWEAVRVPALLDHKATRAVAALETLEGIDGNAGGARRELEQAHRRPRAEARPEPLDHPARFLVPAVVGEPHPVVHVVLHRPSRWVAPVRACQTRAAGLAAARIRAPP